MNNRFHNNVSWNATNKIELYKVWDEDLKKKIKKRNRWEWAFAISVLIVIFGETVLVKASVLGVALYSAVQLMKNFIEEAHVNYLMHKIDVEDMKFEE